MTRKLTFSEYKQHLLSICSEKESENILNRIYPKEDISQNKLGEK
jgi:hypothetical protein